MRKNNVIEYAKALGYDGATYKGQWRSYEIFEPVFNSTDKMNVGKPEFIFALGESVFVAPDRLMFAYMDSLDEQSGIAKTFDEILKANPYHDPETGRFTTGPGGFAGGINVGRNGVTTEEEDRAYMAAVESGDMETASRMVVETAKRAGAQTFSDPDTPAYSIRRGPAPKETVTTYKTFFVDENGNPSALFVEGTSSLPVGVWLDAKDAYHFTAGNGKAYTPSRKNPNSGGSGKTGASVKIPNNEVRQELIDQGFLPEGSKAGAVTALAYRPGWHAGDLPFFPQGGKQGNPEYNESGEKNKRYDPSKPKTNYANIHRWNQVVFECEMAADIDYTKGEPLKSGKNKGKLKYTDMQEMPKDGYYKFATNPMTNAQELGTWYISGSLKINRALSQQECDDLLATHGFKPQEWEGGKMSLDKLGYDPKRTARGTKLLDPVTYDDDGKVIPLSQRFDSGSEDVRKGMSFDEIIEKFNPYHGSDGRFTSAASATSMTYAPGKSRAHDLAIERARERMGKIMPSEAQEKTLKAIETKTRNLKNEQFRVVDRDGNVIMQKQGNKHTVTFTMGEARDNIPGNIAIHNHPEGGTFSSADLVCIGHGATEIRAAAPEGTYTLRNMTKYGGRPSSGQKGWYEMREDLEAAVDGFKSDRELRKEVRKPFDDKLKPLVDTWTKLRETGAPVEEQEKVAKEYTEKAESMRPQIAAAVRAAYVDQYHHWYKENAGKYGLEYTFTPVKTRTRKGLFMERDYEDILKSAGDIDLDGQMVSDVEEITNAIMEELRAEVSPVGKSEFTIFKADDDKRLVFGWASIAVTVDGEVLEDRQGDMIDPEDLEETVYEYVLNFRDTGEEHIPTMRKKGKLVESCVLTREKQRAMGIPEGVVPVGWWIGFKIEDDAAWDRVKNGTYKMFSIEGRANRVPVEKAAAMTFEQAMNGVREMRNSGRFDTIVEVGKHIDHIVEIEKFNPYHGADGRFTSAGGAASFTYAPGKSRAHDKAIEREARRNGATIAPNGKPRQYGRADTRDAAEEIRNGGHNSLEKYLDKDGNLTPDRAAVHQKIIDEMLDGKVPVEGRAKLTMLGCGPASGKSSVLNPDTSKDKHAVTIDPDAFKAKLPGYKEMAEKDSGAAAFFHEESSMLAKQFAQVAYAENYNAIFDGTGDGSVNSVRKKIQAARDHGYLVDAKYVSVDTETAVARNQKRYDDAVARGETPRLPPVDMVRKTHAKCTDISVECAKDFDSIEIWDNNGGKGEQKMIAKGGGGKGLTVASGQDEAFRRYLSKGMKGEAGFVTLADGQVVPDGKR